MMMRMIVMWEGLQLALFGPGSFWHRLQWVPGRKIAQLVIPQTSTAQCDDHDCYDDDGNDYVFN